MFKLKMHRSETRFGLQEGGGKYFANVLGVQVFGVFDKHLKVNICGSPKS